jgi:hypothetical protein
MKPELRSHKNIIYELSKSERGYRYFIGFLNFRSELFEEKDVAIAEARKKIERSKKVKKIGAM